MGIISSHRDSASRQTSCATLQGEIGPLHYAAFYRRLEVVKILLDRGANIEAEESTVSICSALLFQR